MAGDGRGQDRLPDSDQRPLTGQYDHPLRVVAFNPLEGWSRDASEDVAHELEQRVAEGHEVTEPVREFIERFTGRPIGVQLLLPLREF